MSCAAYSGGLKITCCPQVVERAYDTCVNTHDHLVLVPARTLGDLLDLTDRAIDRLDGLEPRDPLQEALRGAVAEVRTHSLLEPSAP